MCGYSRRLKRCNHLIHKGKYLGILENFGERLINIYFRLSENSGTHKTSIMFDVYTAIILYTYSYMHTCEPLWITISNFCYAIDINDCSIITYTYNDNFTRLILFSNLCIIGRNMHPKRLYSDHLTPTPTLDIAKIKLIIAQHVTNTLVYYEANRNNAHKQSRVRRNICVSNTNIPRACTYKEIMNYKPKSFYDNEGIIRLTHWIENIELIFHVNSCVENRRVKFDTCTFMKWYLA